MKVLITGNRGFVGSETQRLIESFRVPDPRSSTLNGLPTGSKQEHTVIGYDLMDCFDIRDKALLRDYVRHNAPDRILHLAAIARFSDADKDPQLAFETNVMGTKNVAAIAREFNIPLVYSSTGSVYMPIQDYTGSIKEDWPAKGNSVYGCTKFAGETYVRQHNPHIILRYAHLYGREKRMHGLIGGFLERIERGLAPTLYGGKQSNDFTYIKDIASANLAALTAPWDKWNQIYNVGTGEELSAKEAGEAVCEVLNWPKDKIEIKEQRTVDPDRFLFDCSKAERMLGFKAKYSFAEGLRDMFADDIPKIV